ncbi:hypothetical protein BC940DRAFT_305552 [Gongronella butleri]|nr:hypothetical protein BC940DRAFT_305552 [Gongronella butleri]
MLPSELWALVFKRLWPKDLLECALVNRQLNENAALPLYTVVHLRSYDQCTLLARTLETRPELGELVRYIYAYNDMALTGVLMASLQQFTPNVRYFDMKRRSFLADSALFRDGPLWPQLTHLPHWQNEPSGEELERLPLTSIHCRSYMIFSLVRPLTPVFASVTNMIVMWSGRYAVDCLVGLLDAIHELAPALTHLTFGQGDKSLTHTPFNENPPMGDTLAAIEPVVALRSLHIDFCKLDQPWINYVHKLYPNLTSLSIRVLFHLGTPFHDEIPRLSLPVGALEHLEIDLSRLRQPMRLVPHLPAPMLIQWFPDIEQYVIGKGQEVEKVEKAKKRVVGPSDRDLPLKSLSWKFYTSDFAPWQMANVPVPLFDQLTEIELSLLPDANSLCWLRLCAHDYCLDNHATLPLLRRLSLANSQVTNGSFPIDWRRLMRRAPLLVHLDIKGWFLVFDGGDGIDCAPTRDLSLATRFPRLQSLQFGRTTFLSPAVLQDLLTSCPNAKDLLLYAISLCISDDTLLPVLIDAPDRDFDRLCTSNIIFKGKVPSIDNTTHHVSFPLNGTPLRVPSISVTLGILKLTQPLPSTQVCRRESKIFDRRQRLDITKATILLRCRHVYKHVNYLSLGDEKFSFDYIHVDH